MNNHNSGKNWSIQVWTRFNNVQSIDQINTALPLKHIKRLGTFENYTSFPIYYLKWQSAFEILTSSCIMIWLRSSCVTGNKRISVMPYWKCVGEKRDDKSHSATSFFPSVSGSFVCSLKMPVARQIFITSFVYLKKYIMLKYFLA